MNLLYDILEVFIAIFAVIMGLFHYFWIGLKYYIHRIGELHNTFTENVTHSGVLSVVLYIIVIVVFIVVYNNIIDSADKKVHWNNAVKKEKKTKKRAEKEKKADKKPSYMDYKNDKSTVSAEEIERRRKIAKEMEAELAETKRRFAESQKENNA